MLRHCEGLRMVDLFRDLAKELVDCISTIKENGVNDNTTKRIHEFYDYCDNTNIDGYDCFKNVCVAIKKEVAIYTQTKSKKRLYVYQFLVRNFTNKPCFFYCGTGRALRDRVLLTLFLIATYDPANEKKIFYIKDLHEVICSWTNCKTPIRTLENYLNRIKNTFGSVKVRRGTVTISLKY